jgi:hypothetical protein
MSQRVFEHSEFLYRAGSPGGCNANPYAIRPYDIRVYVIGQPELEPETPSPPVFTRRSIIV